MRTHLEMSSPSDVRPRLPARHRVELRPESDLDTLRALQHAIGVPHLWSCVSWSDEQWRDELSRPDLRHWVGVVDDAIVGLLAIRRGADGDREITAFGLHPDHVGRGIGGDFLTEALRIAWDADARRVWLHTSSLDHPAALPNYQARGFRITGTETRSKDVGPLP